MLQVLKDPQGAGLHSQLDLFAMKISYSDSSQGKFEISRNIDDVDHAILL